MRYGFDHFRYTFYFIASAVKEILWKLLLHPTRTETAPAGP